MERLSGIKGIGGEIKKTAEDFIVEEITKSGKVLALGETCTPEDLNMHSAQDGKFSLFVLQKKDWNTIQALSEVAKRTRRSIRSVGFAGTKDRTAISTQLCSIFGVKPSELAKIHIKDISINGIWESSEGIKLGDLLGNRFTIKICDAENPGMIDEINSGLSGIFPNYFGEQRFGSRCDNVQIGASILQGDFEKAAMLFLTDTQNESNELAIEARKRLAEEHDFRKALQFFPPYLRYERIMLEYLSEWPSDYCTAFRRLPRQLLLMFGHSVEAYIFNKELGIRVENKETGPSIDDYVCLPDKFGFPNTDYILRSQEAPDKKFFIVGNIVGFETKLLTDFEASLLESMGISKDDFKVKRMPELNMKGSRRVLFAPYLDFSSNAENTRIKDIVLKFSLPAGSYATVLLDEFMTSSNG